MLVIWFCWFVCYCSVGFSKYRRHRDQANQHLFDPEPDRTLHRLLREQRTEHARNRTTMENNEVQNLNIERNEPQRGRNGNNGRNQAPRPFIQPDGHFMLLDEFVLYTNCCSDSYQTTTHSRKQLRIEVSHCTDA